jgi:hypothetical protein
MAKSYFNIDNFQADVFKYAHAHANRFEMFMSLPSGLYDSASAKAAALRCDTITMPGKNLRTVTNENIYGPTHEIAQGLIFAETISATFTLSADHFEKRVFDNWINYIYNPDTFGMGFYKDYVGTMNIYQLDKDNNITYGITLFDVFPKTINPIEYSNSNGEIIKLGVDFAFREWKEIEGFGLNTFGGQPSPPNMIPQLDPPSVFGQVFDLIGGTDPYGTPISSYLNNPIGTVKNTINTAFNNKINGVINNALGSVNKTFGGAVNVSFNKNFKLF